MRVCEIMTPDVKTVPSDMNLNEAARKMRAWDIGILPVVEDDMVVGVITDRDIAMRGPGEGRIAELATARDIMTPLVFWCYDDDVLTEAAKIMEENHVRRLLVLNASKRLVGILSLDDLAAHMSSDRLLGETLRHVSAPGEG
jgi:CBS domain-containing protein